MAAGFAAAALWAVVGIAAVSSKIDDFQRVPLGASAEVTFPKAGAYVVYYERPPGAKGGPKLYVGTDAVSKDLFPDFELNIESLEGGVGGGLNNYRSSLTYNVHGHSGTAVATFLILQPGRFMFHTTTSSEAGGLVALGPGVGRRAAATVIGGLALALGGVVIGGATMLFIGAKRRNARRRLEMGALVFGRTP